MLLPAAAELNSAAASYLQGRRKLAGI